MTHSLTYAWGHLSPTATKLVNDDYTTSNTIKMDDFLTRKYGDSDYPKGSSNFGYKISFHRFRLD